MEIAQIEVLIGNDRRHSCPTVVVGDAHAENNRLRNSRTMGNYISNFCCRDIFAFPPEGVAGAVHEIIKAAPILAHDVAGHVPNITLNERIAQNLVVGFRSVGVAFESAGSRLTNAANRVASLADTHPDAEAIRTAQWLSAFDI